MPVENPYVRVWHLIEAARGSVDPDRRRTLISEAFDVVKEARPPQAAEKESRKPVYGLKLESEGNPPLSLSLEVWSRADAFWAAEVIAIASSEEYDEFGLWEGATYLYGGATRCCWSEATPSDIALATQRLILEHEELLLNSRSAPATSRKLLEDTARLRELLSERRLHH
jgi:hypothetical protein